MTAHRAPRIRRSIAAALALAATIALVGCTGPANEDASPTASASPSSGPDAPGTSNADAAFSGGIAATESGGARPELSWPAVPGAALYRLAVVQDDGPGWAWSGTDTSVVLGGGDAGRIGPGFALRSPGTAYLLALDADGIVLDSGLAPLAGP